MKWKRHRQSTQKQMIHESRFDLSREELSRTRRRKKVVKRNWKTRRIADGYEIVADITESAKVHPEGVIFKEICINLFHLKMTFVLANRVEFSNKLNQVWKILYNFISKLQPWGVLQPRNLMFAVRTKEIFSWKVARFVDDDRADSRAAVNTLIGSGHASDRQTYATNKFRGAKKANLRIPLSKCDWSSLGDFRHQTAAIVTLFKRSICKNLLGDDSKICFRRRMGKLFFVTPQTPNKPQTS